MVMWYAFYNGYPLVTSDTGAYIRYAFDFQVLKDRSSFYSVFAAVGGLRTLHFAGVHGSAWLPVFFQCVIITWLLLRYYRLIAGRMPGAASWLTVVAVIVTTTGLSWVASYFMPDIFAGILLLAFLLFTLDKNASRFTRITYLGMIAAAVLVHNSHFLILPMATGLLLVTAWVRGKYDIRNNLARILLLTACCWMFMCSINYSKGLGFTLSAASHAFMVGKLAETGVLQQYLSENCDTKSNKLYLYQNEIPGIAYHYLWDDYSPFYKIGGWDSSATVHNPIIKDIFTNPRYAYQFAKQSVRHTAKQLSFISIPEGEVSHGVASSPFKYINIFIKPEMPQYMNSHQMKGTIDNTAWIIIQRYTFLLSSIAVLLLIGNMPGRRKIAYIYLVVCMFIISNAFVTATFANVLDRLQIRVFWVLPATNIIVLLQYFISRKAMPEKK